MREHGVIYKASSSAKQGEVRIALAGATRRSFHALRGAGAGLIAFAVVMLLFTFAPIALEEVNYHVNSPGYETLATEASTIEEVQNKAGELGVGSHFSLVVPKIGAAANVTANVDPGNEADYSRALRQGVAHAKGTYFPGQGQSIFLFAHSTNSPIFIGQYNAVFYLLNKLAEDDQIVVFFADREYIYEVREILRVAADDVSWLEPQGEEVLILQTCDPPGTTLRRLLVIARPVL